MIRFVQFILEGGNIKIGDVSAAPFSVTEKNRSERVKDAKDALSELHDSFHNEHGEHLFGKDKKGLASGSIFAGSTRQLMDPKISDSEFAKHKSTVGDMDVQVMKDHGDKLTSHLTPGKRFGKYTVVGTKKHGNEISAVMKHDNGEHHQFDFEKVHYENSEPTPAEQFLHSANWEDTKAGIKGAHHKILLNAAGGTTHKFSISHGLRSRTDESDPGAQHPNDVSARMFGNNADHSKVTSFLGVSDLINNHIPKEQHQAIYDKFKEGVSRLKVDNEPALAHLRKTLGVHD